MDVTSATSAASTGQAASAQKTLSSNFDTFLTLLTTQLQNQDPLQPMDSNQFTQQLVQFSQVEQQINSNKNLESLIALTKSQTATNAVPYLGKTLTLTDGTAAVIGGQAQWTYTVPNTVGPTKFPGAHNEPTPCGSLVRSDGSAYTALVPYTCGKVVKVTQ